MSAALLDQILSSTGPRIISESHNAGAINWVAGMSDPGEMIGCGRYQQLRRQAGETDTAYQARIEYLLQEIPQEDADRIRAFGVTAATRRAALDTSTGRVAVMVAGKAPWHGLGVNVADAVNSADAIRLASLDWQVKKQPLYYQGPTTAEYRQTPSAYAIVRQDTGAALGTVGRRYEPIQNADGFAFLDEVLSRFGARYETAGAIHGGKKIWMQVRLPEQSFTVGHRDHVDAYAIFTNPHDGDGKAYCYPTSERAVCANTLRVADAGKSRGIGIRHSGSIKAKVADAQAALHIAVNGMSQFAEQAQTLGRTPCPDIRHYADNILDAVLDVTAAERLKGSDALAAALAMTDAEHKSLERRMEKRGEILDDILTRYESDRCGLNGQRGTAWAALNAVTEHADHSPLYRYVGSDEAKASRRFESVLAGPADEMKQIAYRQALTLAS